MAAPALFNSGQSAEAERLCRLIWVNPFSPERAEAEASAGVSGEVSSFKERNLAPALTRAAALLQGARPRLPLASEADRNHYEELVCLLLFHEMIDALDAEIKRVHSGKSARKLRAYPEFVARLNHYLPEGFRGALAPLPPDRLFAVFYQLRRAFHNIFAFIVGGSPSAQRLRARVWQSVFTRDLRRYHRNLAGHMNDVATLILGPSGSGKELVAQGVGWSAFIPFDPVTQTFADDFRRGFFPVNLSALSSQLIESELFGHRKGAFTGALQDRQGYLAACGEYGSVFLDEIGEIEPAVQVKLLRVLQTRRFTPIGATEDEPFAGKVIAATNRDLAAEINAGRFREDVYYRLNADRIQTPALCEILNEVPGELETLVAFIARKAAGEAADDLTEETVTFIRKKLPADYRWPGNFRELEQCVRNVMVHGDYVPAPPKNAAATSEATEHWNRYTAGEFTVDELLRDYISRLYAKEPNYGELARRLGKDWRTVRKYAD
ncbi:MAG: sigma 54-interacting transcriptional regulator [Opitutales bacterium]